MKMLCNVKLSPHRYKTPEGYLYCQDAILARTGKQTYLKSEIYGISDDEDVYIDVDRNEKEVFNEKTLASFEGKPLTIEHPDVNVSPENYKELSVGHIQNVRKGTYEGQPVMLADIIVNDAEAISLIESGEMVQLSCGYDCDITDGPNPEQINIRGNHVALCEQGRAGIARIQDSKKGKWGVKSLGDEDLKKDRIYTLSISYPDNDDGEAHYFTVYVLANNYEDAMKIVNKHFEGEKEMLFAPLNPIDYEDAIEWFKKRSEVKVLDSNKKIMKDAVGRGSYIQEFGRYGEQYKVVKIDGNVLYCEELVTKKNTLFKKDKENIDWAIINKGQVNDSVSEGQEEDGTGLYVNGELIKNRSEAWELARKLYKEGKLKEFSEYWIDVFGYPHDTDMREPLKHTMKDSVSTNRELLYSQDPHYTLQLQKDRLYHDYGIDGIARGSGYRESEYDDKIYDNFEEAKKAAIELFNKYKDKTEIKPESYSYYSVRITKWEDGGGIYVDLNDQNNGPFPALTAYNQKELPERLKKDLHIKDSLNVEERNNNFYNDLFDMVNKLDHVDLDSRYLNDYMKILIFDLNGNLDWNEFKKEIKDLAKKHNVSIERFGFETGWNLVSTPIKKTYTLYLDEKEEELKDSIDEELFDKVLKMIKSGKITDDELLMITADEYTLEEARYDMKNNPAKIARALIEEEIITPKYFEDSNEKYVIALKEDNNQAVWLDENDKPTNDYKLAKRFNSKEEADSHQRIYCKGSVCKVNDSLDIPSVKKELEELLKDINHDKIEESWGSITIDFNDRKEARKAKKILDPLYDVELFNDKDNIYIAIYDKFENPHTSSLVEDSETWGSYNLRRGKPAQDFKQYLRDRGLYFEPSENGEFIHFEVKNPDEDVIKEIRAINEHYTKVGMYDEYSRRFYSKAIKALNDKLEKLERNELLDSNQEDYQTQKNNMIKEIKKQIDEYQQKLNELD